MQIYYIFPINQVITLGKWHVWQSPLLFKQLRELEANGIVTRTVYDTIPATVEYELTKSGLAFRNVLDVMSELASA